MDDNYIYVPGCVRDHPDRKHNQPWENAYLTACDIADDLIERLGAAGLQNSKRKFKIFDFDLARHMRMLL